MDSAGTIFIRLHRAACCCATELARGEKTNKYLSFCIKKIKFLLQYHITPIVVFDGGRLPMKKQTEQGRKDNRRQMKILADELYAKGEHEKASKKYIECITITSEMIEEFIKELKKQEVEFIVAPYEADAQLAYLSKKEIVSLVITEDSDLLAFGCSNVFYKLDNDGYGYEIQISKLSEVREYNFIGFYHDMFLNACILSGCDYLDSIKGIGFKTACELIRKHNNNVRGIISSVSTKYIIPKDYESNFSKAFLTFKFQVVFCPITKVQRYLGDIENTQYKEINNISDKSFLGVIQDPIIAQGISNGVIDPNTNKLRNSKAIFDIDAKLYNGMMAAKKPEEEAKQSIVIPAIEVKPVEMPKICESQGSTNSDATSKKAEAISFKLAPYCLKRKTNPKSTFTKKPIVLNSPNYIVNLENFKMVTTALNTGIDDSLKVLNAATHSSSPPKLNANKIKELENFRFQPNLLIQYK
jgi:exonuclease-1